MEEGIGLNGKHKIYNQISLRPSKSARDPSGDGVYRKRGSIGTYMKMFPQINTAWFMERVGRISYPKGIGWKAVIGEKLRYCEDVDNNTTIDPVGREVGTKSYLCMPISLGDKTMGL